MNTKEKMRTAIAIAAVAAASTSVACSQKSNSNIAEESAIVTDSEPASTYTITGTIPSTKPCTETTAIITSTTYLASPDRVIKDGVEIPRDSIVTTTTDVTLPSVKGGKSLSDTSGGKANTAESNVSGKNSDVKEDNDVNIDIPVYYSGASSSEDGKSGTTDSSNTQGNNSAQNNSENSIDVPVYYSGVATTPDSNKSSGSSKTSENSKTSDTSKASETTGASDVSEIPNSAESPEVPKHRISCAPPALTRDVYVVQPGDMICTISAKYPGTKYPEILEFNQMSENDIIYPGDEIAIPVEGTLSSSNTTGESVSGENAGVATDSSSEDSTENTASSGEANSTPETSPSDEDKEEPTDDVPPSGEDKEEPTDNVPPSGEDKEEPTDDVPSDESKDPTGNAPSDENKEPTENAPSDETNDTSNDVSGNNDSTEYTEYIVQPNDGFYSIAEKFGISQEDAHLIAEFNGLTLDSIIYEGVTIKIPSSATILNMKSVAHAGNKQPSSSDENQSSEDSVSSAETNETVSNTDSSTDSSSDSSSDSSPDSSPDSSSDSSSDNSTDSSLDESNNTADDVSSNSGAESTGGSHQSDESTTDTANTDANTSPDESQFYGLLGTIHEFESEYVGTTIAMGIYSLDGTPLFEYNQYTPISGACTVKAGYAAYVLNSCENQGIDIWSETITYEPYMKNNGSGIIKNSEFGTEYSINYLLTQLLSISDNTAYNILLSRFPLPEFQNWLDSVGGQQLYGLQYGACTVNQRKNEWIAIYNYINSGSTYSNELRNMLSNTYYCYLVQGMANYHNYLHKSGWADDDSGNPTYTAAGDCAIIDDRYLVIVLSQDYVTGTAHTDIVQVLGREAELFMG